MSRLVDLFITDRRVIVGRPLTPYPVSFNAGFGIVGQLITGFTPITTQVQTGWRTDYTKPQIWPPRRPPRLTIKPVYTTVTTGYAPVYSPMFGGIY